MMREILIWYFSFGIGFYVGMCVKNPWGFAKASVAAILRGILLGIFFWPIGLIVQVVFVLIDMEVSNGQSSDN